MKKSAYHIIVLSAMMLILTACPYSSSVPISAATESINKDLLGEWVSASELSYDQPTYFKISKLDKTRYELVEFSYSSYDSSYSQTPYIMHTTTIGEMLFLNIQERAGGDYHLHRIELGKNEFLLFEISDNVDEKFNKSEDLKAFIEKNMHHSFFYTKGEKRYVTKK